MIKKVLDNKLFRTANKLVLSIFYKRKYLAGKYFDEQRNGFVWAWRGIFRSIPNRRKKIYWPIGKNVRITNGKNIEFDVDSVNVFQNPGGYFQCDTGKIKIGKGCYVAQNVGIITRNHNPAQPDEYLPAKDVVIGDCCWLGMNVVILPGVHLGNHTTVGAGAVVTHSFEGNCVIAGNPAKVIRSLSTNSEKNYLQAKIVWS